jgi:murein DD-endopeptidase MepM/ murein hydrolase activator NlpD
MIADSHSTQISELKLLFWSSLLLFGIFVSGQSTYAQSTEEIQSQISSHNEQIANLEKEIATYQKQLNVISGQKQTLQSQIASLDISRKKILAQTTVTQNKIAAANLTLNSLALKITDKSEAIELDKKSLAQSLRTIQMNEETTLVERLFNAQSLSDSWVSVDQMVSLNNTFQQHAKDLTSDKIVLTDQHAKVEETKSELSKLKSQLLIQQGELDANKKAKQQLLTQTKATESSYQSIIAQKRAQQKAFEAELSALENSLKATNPATIPHVGSGILAWPFSASFMENCKSKAGVLGNNFCVTQFFGTTAFSTANPQVYNGAGHNAIDISAPTGTAVLAALSGTVLGTGNTDAIPGCYSYGKWVLLKHANGLDTLYTHLSSISVSKGQAVSTGSVVGYSGMTGYATGPHLHFGVYASDATQILTLQQFRGATSPCANAPIPVAPKSAYLNPMSYL